MSALSAQTYHTSAAADICAPVTVTVTVDETVYHTAPIAVSTQGAEGDDEYGTSTIRRTLTTTNVVTIIASSTPSSTPTPSSGLIAPALPSSASSSRTLLPVNPSRTQTPIQSPIRSPTPTRSPPPQFTGAASPVQASVKNVMFAGFVGAMVMGWIGL